MSDYTIDWSNTNVDGNNTIAGPDGDITVSVATPKNSEGKQWFVENGMLKNWDVTKDSSADITFSEEVTNISFTLLDVDRLDEITIMTKDANGNPVPVEFEVTGFHDVNGNVVTGTQTTADGPAANNNQQDIEVTIAGPLKTFWIVLDDGPERSYSGTVAVSDITFDVAEILDGTVEGTAGDDTIDVAYVGDPDGDMVDNNDAILAGDSGDDDLIYGYAGDDNIVAGNGDDEVYGGSGDDSIEGNAGDDLIYGDKGGDNSGSAVFDGTQDFNELATGTLVNNQYVSEGLTISSANANHPVMVFDSANPTGGDSDLHTNNLGKVLILSEDGDSNDPDDNASGGTFNLTFDSPAEVSSLTLLDVEEGAWIKYYDANGNLLEQVDVQTGNNGQCVVDTVVQNVSSMEVILGGSGAIDNLSYSLTSDDEIDDGANGDDIISGGEGDDVIYGDSGDSTSTGGGTVRESFEWDQQSGNDIDNGFVQNTGNVTVTYDRTVDAGNHESDLASDDLNVDGIDGGGETVDDNSGLHSETKGQAGKGQFEWVFSQEVNDVEFNINDVDGDGVVKVTAYDADGNEIPVQLVGGNDITINGNTADSNGGYDDTDSDDYNVQVTIPGPVAKIVVEHTQDGGDNSGIRITDLYYDAPTGGAPTAGGDDVIDGDAGDDVIYGEGGDDVITGGTGQDELYGGDDRDTFIGGNDGDTVDGGTGGDDVDVLDLRGLGQINVIETVDPDGDSTSGTVEFLDGNGNVTGTLEFTEIEQILSDPINHVPTANDDVATVDEDGSVTIDVLANDTDPQGQDLTITGASVPADQGTVEIVNGELVFTPAPDFNGDATITYTVEDPDGNEASATVDVTVNPVNDDPVANDDTAETDEDTPVTIDVLGNDTDVDGDDLTVTNATSPDGEVTINPDGTITFTPDENFNGTTTITYTVDDGNGGTDTATVDVTVNAVDELEAVDDTAETDEDTPVTIDVVANDLNADGGEPTIISATVPADQGTVEIVGNELVFTPAENFNGDATITYTIEDEDGLQDTAEVAVTVNPVNDAPDAVNDTDTTDEDTPITLDVLDNDTDVDGDALTVTGATVPAEQGTVEIVGNQVVFTPAENFNGTATISYSIEDGNGGTDTAIHEVFVTPVNDAPVAVDDIAETFEDEPVVIDLLGNDYDVDGDPLNIGTVSVPPEQGTVVDNGDGTVTFTPAPNYTGPAQITYTVQDGQGGEDSGEAVVNIEVVGVNDGPQAVDDVAETDEDTPVTIDVLDNDFDIEGDDLFITVATVPADQGTVEIVDGELVFTPAPDFNGEATITYGIADENGGTDIGEVIVTVNPVNDDPVAVDDVETTDEDEPITIDLISNDTDVDGDPLSVSSVSVPAEQGTVVDNGDGTVTFTPAPNFNGPATITYTVVDGQGGEDEGQAIVSVGAINDGPEANTDTDTTEEDTPVTVDLLANDTDDDGDDLTVINATVPAEQGTLVDNGDGTVTFTPAPNFNGEATITYEISDGNGGTDISTHVIDVTPVNDAPDAVDDADGTDEDTAITVDLLANDTDVDGDDLTVIEATVPAEQGTLVDNGDGTVTFTPAPDFNGTATISYTIEDEEGLTDSAVHTIEVAEVDDAPDAEDDVAETDEDTPVTIDVLDNDSDPDGDPLTVTEATSPDGTVEINPDGTITFTPDENFNGDTTITYTVEDPDGNEDTATVTVTVAPVNDAPDAVDDADGTDFNTPVTVDLLANDTDVDGDDLTVIEATVPAEQGTLVDNGDGTVTFTPALGFIGEATISYTIEDEEGLTDSAVHVITVAAGELDGTVEGTAGDDLIDGNYLGDPDGDLVDNDDAILPGDVGDDDLIYGYGGDDSIIAGAGDDEVYGGDGDDTIDGVAGNDTLFGDDGEDVISGGQDNDTIFGGADDDTIDGDNGEDSIDGGTGDDTILGGGGDDVIGGGQGDDTIDGETGDDMIFGGAGDDELSGGNGDDKIEGGSGDDTLIGGNGNDDLWGASGDDTVDGGIGNDTISTAEGNDVVYGGDGADIIDTANDQVPLPDLSFGDIIPADGDFPGSSPTDDLDTVFGGAGNDSITTGDDADYIEGGTGNDTIDAGIDADEVYGGEGNDTIIGGEGSDTIFGEEGDDVIYAGLEPGTDLFGIPEQIDDDLGDPEPDNGDDLVYGGAGDDTIFGADDSDVLHGDEGDDVINGEIDDDTLFGGEGDDTLDGGANDDTIEGGEGDDTIIGGTGEDEQYGGLGNDTFLGGNGGDVVVGGEDPDLDGDGNSDDVDVLDLTGSNVDFITYEDDDPEAGTVTFLDGSTMTFSEIENVIPCFTPGTTIATPKGERLVEELREGDRIITRDNGIQEIRWVGRKEMSGKALVANPHLKPILVRAGSLGNGLPERDMLVSPNHRMLVASEKTQLYFEEREVLAAAKHLVGSEGIHAVDVMGTAYIHFMFDRHEVVLSNGAWTESFQPGDYSLKGIGNAQRNEIFELFPELQEKQGLEGYQSARRALKKHEAKLLVR